MNQLKIKDNSFVSKEELVDISDLVDIISDKTLEQLEKEGLFVFPNLIETSQDITKNQMVLKSVNGCLKSENVMGFLGFGNDRLIIESRFSTGKYDYFFEYLLQKVLNIPNIINLDTDANMDEKLFNFLVFLFPYYLKSAMRKGIYKTYIRSNYNNQNVRGTIEIAKHINKNIPFMGNVAYSVREYSYDNYLTELIRHTIEYIRKKAYSKVVLSQVKDEVREIISATNDYKLHNKSKIIIANKKNIIRHAYYREYRALQRLCLLILQYQKHHIGIGTKHIYGILFDGAWLWEEYVNKLIGEDYYHPMNKGGKGAQRLFSNNVGLIYPDFISKDDSQRIIADAKYKPVENVGNRDYLQVLAYMFRFDAKKGLYLYPETKALNDQVLLLNKGSTYEKNVEARNDISVLKYGLAIPNDAENYDDFVSKMKTSEKIFREGISNEKF